MSRVITSNRIESDQNTVLATNAGRSARTTSNFSVQFGPSGHN
jgi:hypothetical protein